jgi:D-alanine transaminase
MTKPRFSYINGRYMQHERAAVHIEDRGFLFSDGVYEGIALVNGKLIDAELHYERLQRSCDILELEMRVSIASLKIIINELIRKNKMHDAFIYLQITRGSAPRNHSFPTPAVRPSLLVVTYPDRAPSQSVYEQGINVLTAPDIRWGRRDAKTISLLPNILAKQAAVAGGCKEAYLVAKDGVITEGSSSNAFMVTQAGAVQTHPATEDILGGITRRIVLGHAKDAGIEVIEIPFTVADLRNASESFITNSSSGIIPVVKVDDRLVANGNVGPVSKKLHGLYQQHIGR